MKAKVIIMFFIAIMLVSAVAPAQVIPHGVLAEETEVNRIDISVYGTNGRFLFARQNVVAGDIYISRSFEKYVVEEVDETTQKGTARFVEYIKKPNVGVLPSQLKEARQEQTKTAGMYMTHNAESYVSGDGTDSIYGKGGIHDVAKALQTALQVRGWNVVLDETLHLPHSTSAYSRSQVTAKRLLNENNPDALFDIHRDGVSRSVYVTKVNGQDRSRIRMVLGQANPNMQVNLQFAISLMAVSEELYPWLFLDIFLATGHYNQGLFEKAILFEMGTYLIEKNLVMQSIDPLAEVIDTTLFFSTIDQEGNIDVGGLPDPENGVDLLNDALTKANQKSGAGLIVFIIIMSISAAAGAVYIIYDLKQISVKDKNKKA